MKRYLSFLFVLCVASASLLMAQSKPASGDDAAVKADKALGEAYAKGDRATIEKLLDPDFSWIDTDGIMMERNSLRLIGMRFRSGMLTAENESPGGSIT